MLDPKTLGTILRQAELARTSALRQLAVLAPGREIATSLRAIVEAQTQASEALKQVVSLPQPPSDLALQESADENAKLHFALRVQEQSHQDSVEALKAEIANLQAENAALKQRVRGHWLADTDTYDWEDHSLPWSLSDS